MRTSWEFALTGTGTIGTAIFAPLERSLRTANVTTAFIVGVLVPRAGRWAGAVVDALLAFGSRAAAKVRRLLRSIIVVRSHWPYDQAIPVILDFVKPLGPGPRGGRHGSNATLGMPLR